MPLYQYSCEFCEAAVEDIRKYADRYKDPPVCETCDEVMFYDEIQTGGTFRTVGGGWFNTGGY